MFGKAEWFRKTKTSLGIAPGTWQGWMYAAGWASVLLLPAAALVGQGKFLETLVWLLASGGLCAFDGWQLRGQVTGRSTGEGEVLYIDENETESARFATRNYQMRSRG